MQCAYCGTQNVRRGSDYPGIPICSNIACYEQYLIEHGFNQAIIMPNLLQPRNQENLSPASRFPFLHQILNQLEAHSPEYYMNESMSSSSDYSDYDREYEENDRLTPLRHNIDQDIDFIEIVFEDLRDELHTYSDRAAIKNIMKEVDSDIAQLMQDIEPPCDNIRTVIRRVGLIKQNIDRLYEILKTVDQSNN